MVAAVVEAIALSAGVSYLAYVRRWLTLDGAGAAFLLGVLVWVTGRWVTSLPLILFFVSGSLFSKLSKPGITGKIRGEGRNAWQVVANGGVAAVTLLLYLVFKHENHLIAYVSSLAMANADTWSSELGSRYGGKPVDLLGRRKMALGTSGGVTMLGTAMGLLGAACMAGCALLFKATGHQVLLITGLGFMGMMADSLIGSALQRKFADANGEWHDVPTLETIRQEGLYFFNNDAVNFLANAFTTVIAYWILFT